MQIAVTENDKMMSEIMQFTQVIVGVTEMRNVPIQVRAEAILMAEQLFHRVVMGKMIQKCGTAATPCNN